MHRLWKTNHCPCGYRCGVSAMSNYLDMDFGGHLIDHDTSDDYYTPPFIFEALGVEFDLDVSAPPGGVGVSVMHRLLTPLTSLVRFVLSTRAAVADSSRRTTLTAVLLLSVALPYTAQAYESKDELRLYAHSRIVDYKQFICFQQTDQC
jgi:hypothetical protein